MYDCPVQHAPFAYKFTGKERDAESGLDDFDARFYSSSFGRFMTPDWAAKPTAVPYAHFGNPQSLNLYSYVQNNPTTVGDPDGHGDPPSPADIAESHAALDQMATDYLNLIPLPSDHGSQGIKAGGQILLGGATIASGHV